MRFSGIIVNPTVRFGVEVYPTVRFGAVFKIGNLRVRFGAVFNNRKSYGAVRCGLGKPEILRCGSV